MTEKRTDQRSPIELAASYGIGEDSRPAREACVNNISSGGFCFTSDQSLRVGQEIEVSVELDTVEAVVVAVKVIWVTKNDPNGKYRIGVQIIERQGPDFDRFVEFYNQQM